MAPRVTSSRFASQKSSEELTAEILGLVGKYREAGVRLSEFNHQNFLQLFLTSSDVRKMFRFLDSFLQRGIFLGLVSQAESRGIITAGAPLTPHYFLELHDWLRSPEGEAVARKLQVERKLLKSAVIPTSPQEMAFARILEQQRIDYSTDIKQNRAVAEGRILDSMVLIHEEREDIAAAEEKCKLRYPAVAGFPCIKIGRLRELCWIKYLDRCNGSGETPEPKTSAFLGRVTDEFQAAVTQEMVQEYCREPEVRRSLLKYGRKRIKRLVSCNEVKEAERFRVLVSTALGETTATPGLPLNEASDESGSDGQDQEESGEFNLLLVSGGSMLIEEDDDGEEEVDGDADEASFAEGGGDGVTHTVPVANKKRQRSVSKQDRSRNK